mmetsp:Transcript_28556/g.66352  ORF Transcript_28556/g.66352 Transcript_28556/m.66352 type:complete len:229 (+) Transcript_28556:2149-2835(+)
MLLGTILGQRGRVWGDLAVLTGGEQGNPTVHFLEDNVVSVGELLTTTLCGCVWKHSSDPWRRVLWRFKSAALKTTRIQQICHKQQQVPMYILTLGKTTRQSGSAIAQPEMYSTVNTPLRILWKAISEMYYKRFLPTTGMGCHPIILFFHDCSEGRTFRKVGKNFFFHFSPVYQPFPTPDPNQSKSLHRSCERIVTLNVVIFVSLPDHLLQRRDSVSVSVSVVLLTTIQ